MPLIDVRLYDHRVTEESVPKIIEKLTDALHESSGAAKEHIHVDRRGRLPEALGRRRQARGLGTRRVPRHPALRARRLRPRELAALLRGRARADRDRAAGELRVRRRVVPGRDRRGASDPRGGHDHARRGARRQAPRSVSASSRTSRSRWTISRRCSRRLNERGIEIGGGPMPRGDGVDQAFFLDPDGYVVEVFERTGKDQSDAPPRMPVRAEGSPADADVPPAGRARAGHALLGLDGVDQPSVDHRRQRPDGRRGGVRARRLSQLPFPPGSGGGALRARGRGRAVGRPGDAAARARRLGVRRRGRRPRVVQRQRRAVRGSSSSSARACRPTATSRSRSRTSLRRCAAASVEARAVFRRPARPDTFAGRRGLGARPQPPVRAPRAAPPSTSRARGRLPLRPGRHPTGHGLPPTPQFFGLWPSTITQV